MSLGRCIRHIPPGQLLRRAWLTAKRKTIVSPVGRPFRVRRGASLAHSQSPPDRVFPARFNLVDDDDDGSWLTHLNQRYSLTPPVDWVLQDRRDATHLQRLAIHYHEFLEAVRPQLGRRLILDWIHANPPWQRDYWMNSWNCYGISIRCVCWMQWLARHSGLLTKADDAAIEKSLVEQLRFLCHNLETDIRGNHLIRNIRCLMWAGKYFDCPESKSWWKTGLRLLNKELNTQFLADGMHFELSPAYHCQVLCDLLDVATLVDDDARREMMIRLSPAAQAMVDLTHPDGLISLFSDGGLEMTYRPQECLAVWERLGGEAVQPSPHFALRNSGYYGLRTSRSYLAIDCGPVCAPALPAHGHADMLSFEWDVDSHRVVVDAGVFEYESGAARTRCRSVQAHNTVRVGDLDQCELIGSFRTGRRARAECDEFDVSDGQVLLKGHHDGFCTRKDRCRHTRTITARQCQLLLQDHVSGSSSQRCISRLLFHHDCQVKQTATNQVRILSRGTEISLQSEATLTIAPAEWSPDFGVRHKTTCVEVDYGTTPCSASIEFRVK
jgi:uncharacterized heparinase superfamily protein